MMLNRGVTECSAAIADGMTVVVTETGARRDERAVRAEGPPLTAAPLTVMVNEHTASASEIFAGALHDNCRALLVGTRHASLADPWFVLVKAHQQVWRRQPTIGVRGDAFVK